MSDQGTTMANHIAARVNSLPSFPTSVQRVIEELESPCSTAERVAVALELDPPLVASVLRVANSGFFGGRAKTSSAQTAVTRLGLQEVRGIVTAAALLDVLGGANGLHETEMLYGLALASALVVGRVVRRSAVIHANAASAFFTTALLHDIGLFALFCFTPDLTLRCLSQAHAKALPFHELERPALGYTHTELGAMLLQRWRLGEVEIDGCRWHHTPGVAPKPVQHVAALVHIAEFLVLEGLRGQPLSALAPKLSVEALTILRITRDEFERLRIEVKPCIDHAGSMAEGLLSPSRTTPR